MSGGGIRAAAFGLGVYQCLAPAGYVRRARYLSAVSGGSYVAGAAAIANAECPEQLRFRKPGPWERNSPEELTLRKNLTYLAPGNRGWLWLAANVVFGFALNLLPFLLAALLVGRIVGAALHVLYPGIGTRDVNFRLVPEVIGVLLAGLFAQIVVVGKRRFVDVEAEDEEQEREPLSERVVFGLSCACGTLFAIGIVLPIILQLLSGISYSGLNPNVRDSQEALALTRLTVEVGEVVAACLLGACAAFLVRFRRLQAVGGFLAVTAGVGLFLIPLALSAGVSAYHGFNLVSDGLRCALASTGLLVFALVIHNRRYSLHPYYRERLQEAFALVRSERDGQVVAEAIPYRKVIKLSRIAAKNRALSASRDTAFPELILCAAVAAGGREAPNKARALSLTFDRSGAFASSADIRTDLQTLESGDYVAGGGLTLPALMAISGAAVSPLMGSRTLPAFRFLFAMLNIRLGVWLPNRDHAEARRSSPEGRRFVGGLSSRIRRGWREPGALYVLREALGLAHTSDPFVYVSDGGHVENLGFIELLRRRCSHIVVVDGTFDAQLGDVSRACALARAELGVEFDFDPRRAVPDDAGLAVSPVAVGTFQYPDGELGYIYYARAVMWTGAPSDLHFVARRSRWFPNHPTSIQILSGRLFDAYRALGSAVGRELVNCLGIPGEDADEIL